MGLFRERTAAERASTDWTVQGFSLLTELTAELVTSGATICRARAIVLLSIREQSGTSEQDFENEGNVRVTIARLLELARRHIGSHQHQMQVLLKTRYEPWRAQCEAGPVSWKRWTLPLKRLPTKRQSERSYGTCRSPFLDTAFV